MKSCPCCGDISVMGSSSRYGIKSYFIRCFSCGVRTRLFETKEMAEKVWNKRISEKLYPDKLITK